MAGALPPEVDDVEIKMALFLPRDAASVPVSRQVLDGCLETLGVTPDTRTDIALALSEACANVVQHAKASTVEIDVKVDDAGLELRVVDDGIGIDLARAEVPGRGLANLQERARLLGGNCNVFARPEGGTELSWCVKLLR